MPGAPRCRLRVAKNRVIGRVMDGVAIIVFNSKRSILTRR
jgi:hypothetical protein